MEYRKLGRTGLLVSRAFFGGTGIGEFESEQSTQKLVDAAWDRGINTFYSADTYHNGRAEALLGTAIRSRRNEVNLVIKAGMRVGTADAPSSSAEWKGTPRRVGIDNAMFMKKGIGPTSRGLTRKHLMTAVEASLKRLGTDYIDVYVAHFYDPSTPIEETLRAMDDLVRQGKILYVGCSQTAAWQLYRALWASEVNKLVSYQSQQIHFNVFERDSRREQLRAAEAAGVSVLAFNSLAGELLAGLHSREGETRDSMGFRRVYADMYWTDYNLDFTDEFIKLASSFGRSPSSLAYAWTLAQPAVTALNVGPRSAEGFDPVIQAIDTPLSPVEADAISTLLDRYPALPPTTAGRLTLESL
ncbi:MAG: aldo/keto reductase [Akkermansiaceae bacterium]|jgi:aryl-alcohol dehydrogenase-like predicted oxidoreductase|nr:aldo/keto reductase [Akkermansiaceae bacterium]